MQTVNPATEKILAQYQVMTSQDLQKVLGQADRAFSVWRQSSVEERRDKLKTLSLRMAQDLDLAARMISEEMGKPLAQSIAELKKSQSLCLYLAENLARFSQSEEVPLSAWSRSYIHHAPKGIILGIMPWNFPVWQALRFTLPALAMGNVALLKPAPITTGTTLWLESIIKEVFSVDIFQCLVMENSMVEPLLADSRVRGLSFTGSTPTGSYLASLAGRYLKPVVLELGGSDAYLVLHDADVEWAAKKLVESRMLNNGQSCVAAKRFLVHKSIKLEFTERVVAGMKGYPTANPLSEKCYLGPLARADLREMLHLQVKRSKNVGAQILVGGDLPPVGEKGFYYPATVLDQVRPGQAAFDEEMFGPVASLVEFSSLEEGVKLFNQSQYGLGGGIFSRDIKNAEKLAQHDLDCGMVFINDCVKSIPELPFGGEKNSGIGRELGIQGVYEFTNIKTVVVK